MLRRGVHALPVLLVYLLWVLLVLYPDPMLLVRSIPRAINPPIDSAAVQSIAAKMPNDPQLIEQQVLNKYVPYAVPWQTKGVPWYYPTTREALAMGRGDCEARMLVLASILKAKGIPFQIHASLDHIWVTYPKKRATQLENNAISFIQRTPKGQVKIALPQTWDPRESYNLEKEYYWDPMPATRKLLMLSGLLAIFFRVRIYRGIVRARKSLAYKAKLRMLRL